MTPFPDVAAAGVAAGVAADVASLRPSIASRLTLWDRRAAPADPGRRHAAVAVALFDKGFAAHLLIVKRVPRGTNAGQWALPGGKIDRDEDAVTAALRELDEETGLAATNGDVLGLLDDFMTTSGFVITPVVVAIPSGQRPRRNPAEVASLHPVPLSRLLEPGVPRWRKADDDSPLLQMPLRRDMVIHAPTGAILWQFAEVALRGVARRVTELTEPAFTAR